MNISDRIYQVGEAGDILQFAFDKLQSLNQLAVKSERSKLCKVAGFTCNEGRDDPKELTPAANILGVKNSKPSTYRI
ncbi:hypothetical protein ACLB2K_017242 [Fragaria x ananassa]